MQTHNRPLVFINNTEVAEKEDTRVLRSGFERQIEDLASDFSESYLYIPFIGEAEPPELEGTIEVRRLCNGMHGSHFSLLWYLPIYALGILRVLRKHGPRPLYIVYVPASYLGFLALLMTRIAGVDAVYRITVDWVEEYRNRRHNNIRPFIARVLGPIHDILFRKLIRGQTCFFTGENRWTNEENHHRVDSTSISESDIDLSANGGGLPLEVYFIGRFDDVKGIHDLIDAIPHTDESANFNLIGYGTPSQEREVREHIREIGVEERTVIHGYVPFGEPLFNHLREADVVVIPSRQDARPKVPIESMCFGACVVATEVGGLPSIVDDGRDGILVEPQSPKAIADAIDRLGSDPEFRAHLIEHGYEKAAQNTLEAMNGKIMKTLSDLGFLSEKDK